MIWQQKSSALAHRSFYSREMRVGFALLVSALWCSAQSDVGFLKPYGSDAPVRPRIACAALYALTGFEFTIESAGRGSGGRRHSRVLSRDGPDTPGNPIRSC